MDQGGSNSSSDFVRKLYKMLESPQDESVVRWGNEGDSFVVLENEKFTKHILPKHFKHSNFASFVRQLNKYDFHKVRQNNEDSGTSPYGPGAWEFKHPDFKMNNKDALDNIRRKAPAPRKPNQVADELVPTQQMDLVNTQLLATQQQLQSLQERYSELSMHHSMLLQELIGVQKTVVNHEHVIQYVMNFLNSVDAQRRRESRITGNPFAAAQSGPSATNGNNAVADNLSALDEDVPASPLQAASKLLSDLNADHMLNTRSLEQINETHMRANTSLTSTPPDQMGRNGTRSSSRGAPPNNVTTPTTASLNYGDLDNMVYPIGQTQGIDPMYSEHINNIPYPLPAAKAAEATPFTQPQPQAQDVRKKSTILDPGWIRQPQILLVEDDQTCRRIGGKFLYAFQCAVDSALDGLEAVNKMNGASKYDLVLMDIIMPNLDGVSATHLIRQFDHATPIVAMTSNIRSDDISMYFQHGMNDVLPKPFTKDGLLNMLEKHLSHLKKHNANHHNSNSAGGMSIDTMAPPLSTVAAKRALKPDDSPATSPATVSNWNSPSNLSGISPASAAADDPYSAGPFGAPPPQGPAAGVYGIPGMQQQQQPHRRGISEISGGPGDMGPEQKRQQQQQQQMYGAPPQMGAPGMGMQRGGMR